ncbi:GxxExxY protein [Roseimarinus sediminis]|uniref:GxxExxY protein n=1 Tax=Roseimarinus sediminis TaxID=1610899 RepID=UPI003D1AD0B6
MDLLFEKETYSIIGACMSVHKELGNGFLESVYEEALEREFTKRNIPYKRQCRLNVLYDGKPLDKYFKADFLCFDQIILEIKAANFLHPDNQKQVINYINAAEKAVGLLINFGEPSLKWKRFINSKALE